MRPTGQTPRSQHGQTEHTERILLHHDLRSPLGELVSSALAMPRILGKSVTDSQKADINAARDPLASCGIHAGRQFLTSALTSERQWTRERKQAPRRLRRSQSRLSYRNISGWFSRAARPRPSVRGHLVRPKCNEQRSSSLVGHCRGGRPYPPRRERNVRSFDIGLPLRRGREQGPQRAEPRDDPADEQHRHELRGPRQLGGGAIERPRGVVVLGDCIDDGDRKLDGKPRSAPSSTSSSWPTSGWTAPTAC